jgi:tungstate transport system substrate-binding protein
MLAVLSMALAAGLALSLPGCGSGSGGKTITLAATSDLEQSGVLDAWIKDFRKQAKADVNLVTATDQEVLAMARHGECDVLITHVPDQEKSLQSSNITQGRQVIMQDDYVIVGPPGDPAGIKGSPAPADALKKLGTDKRAFIIRSDGSGITFEEADLWGATGIQDFGDWLIENAASMGDILKQASDRGAYTMCDRTAFEAMSGDLQLEIAYEDSQKLADPYSVMEVTQLAYPDTNLQAGQQFADYLQSSRAQRYFYLGSWAAPDQGQGGQGQQGE